MFMYDRHRRKLRRLELCEGKTDMVRAEKYWSHAWILKKIFRFGLRSGIVQVEGETYPKLKILVLMIAIFRSGEAEKFPTF